MIIILKTEYRLAYEEIESNPFITISELAQKYDFSKSSFYRALKKENIPLPKKSYRTTCSEEKLELVGKLFEQNISIIQISHMLNMGERTISKYLHYNNFDIKCNVKTKDLYCNTTFFDTIDNEQKAYWLGFIFADGCVTNKKSYRLTIELNNIDENHLNKFKQSICSNHPISYRKNRPICSLSITNKKLISDLTLLGCVPNKTNDGIINSNCIPQSLYSHFLRGYLDGDGYIDKTRYRIIYTIKNEFVTNQIIEMFAQFNINFKKKKEKAYYRVFVEDKANFIKAISFLYAEANMYLDRKFQTYQTWLNKLSPIS